MKASPEGLAPYPGEPRSAIGWRLGRASWRLTRQSGAVALPTLGLVAFFTLATCIRIFAGVGFPGGGFDDPWLARLLIDVPTTFAVVYFGAAMAAGAEAELDGLTLEASELVEEVRDAAGPLTAFAGLGAAAWIGIDLVADMTGAPGLAAFLSFAWSVVAFYAIPVILLQRPDPTEALAESWRLVRWHWRETIGGLFCLAIFGGLLMLPSIAIVQHAAALNREGADPSDGLIVLGAIATALALAFLIAARECFAVSVYRLEVEDLPGVAFGGVAPRRRTRAFRVARGFVVVILLVVAFSALTESDRETLDAARGPGDNYAIVISADPESLSSGSPVLYSGRQIGVVLGAQSEAAGLKVTFHVDPGYGPSTTPGSFEVRPCGSEFCLVLIPTGTAPEESETL
jgi:Family of unknown function (DUF6159)